MTVLDYLERRWDHVLELAVQHLLLVLGAVAIAAVVGIVTGLLVYRRPRIADLAISSTSALFTVPALAYFAVLVVFLGLGTMPSLVTLAIYGLLPIVRNTVTGLNEVDPAVVRSATGMGMGRWQALMRVELPLALPVILTGVRVATVLSVGIAAIAAYVGGPGLGSEIFGGLRALGSARAVPQALVGTVAIVLVTVALDLLIAGVSRLTTSKGIR